MNDIAARDAEKNAKAVAALRALGIQASSRTLNVTDEAACKLLIQHVSAQYGAYFIHERRGLFFYRRIIDAVLTQSVFQTGNHIEAL